jgi:hypothetical protein
MRTRRFALVAGVLYVVAGVAGFIPSLGDTRVAPALHVDSHYRDLFGLFPVNILHNIVHLAIGALGILAYSSFRSARTYSQVLAVVYALLAVMGLISAGDLKTTFDYIPLFSNDIWLHAVTAAIAAYFGFGPVSEVEGDVDVAPAHLDRDTVRPGGLRTS